MDFYKKLNYSFGNEDWSVEKQALCIAPGDQVIGITASGDRVLHLLMSDCKKVISVDMNDNQNHLLELKMAAISQLDYEKYTAFLGCQSTSHRLSIFRELKPLLTPKAVSFWAKNKKLISNGIIYQGRTERFTKLSAKFFQTFRPDKVNPLFGFNDLEEQQHYVAIHWDNKLWRKFFEFMLNPNFFKFILNDPGLHSYADGVSQSGIYIFERMMRYLNNHLAKKSALLQLIFLGKVLPEAYFPYLTWDGYNEIRNNIDRLEYKTDNIIQFLMKQEPNSIDCFSLSDIASYMPQASFEQLMMSVYHASKPNARFCVREFMSKRYIPSKLIPHFRRKQDLEIKLESEESNFVYRFMVGQVRK